MMIDIIVHEVECECIGVHRKIQKLVKVTGVIFGESDIVIVIFVLTVLFITVLNAVVITPIAVTGAYTVRFCLVFFVTYMACMVLVPLEPKETFAGNCNIAVVYFDLCALTISLYNQLTSGSPRFSFHFYFSPLAVIRFIEGTTPVSKHT